MIKPIVSIVGRPNVGKSTLFNKIIGRKISITKDSPGVTRDRIYGESSWLGRDFVLIDTGGLDLYSEDIFKKNIKEQVQLAVETSEVIIFLLDGLSSITLEDEEIAQYLRRTKKNVIVAINKFDSKKAKENYFDFFNLGLGEPIKLSAESGQGVGDLLDAVIKNFPIGKSDEFDDSIRVSIIGKPNVGKSSLINYITKENRSIVTDIPGTTRDSIDSKIIHKDNEYTLVDTAGLRKKKKIKEEIERYSVIRTLSSIERSDVCVLMIDAYESITEQDTKIAGFAHDNNKAMVIAVNKWDLIEKDDKTMRRFEDKIRTTLSFMPYAQIVFISVKDGKRIVELLDQIELANNNYNHRIQTGVLNTILTRATLMNQPPSDKGKRGKLYYGTQVSVRPPKFILYVNDSKLFHFSYRRYLENQIRQTYSFDGTPIVLEFKNRKDGV